MTKCIRICPFCKSNNTTRQGKRYFKNPNFHSQRFICKRCSKRFTLRIGNNPLLNKIKRKRKSDKSFMKFIELNKIYPNISSRKLKDKMLHEGHGRYYVSHKTLVEWKKQIAPRSNFPSEFSENGKRHNISYQVPSTTTPKSASPTSDNNNIKLNIITQ
jgi:hypothetical protein